MEKISAFRRQLETHRPADWETLPDFPLYMDQVLSYMERQTIRLDESDALTASMVNNYTKNALVPRAEGKKYNREELKKLISGHLCRCTGYENILNAMERIVEEVYRTSHPEEA